MVDTESINKRWTKHTLLQDQALLCLRFSPVNFVSPRLVALISISFPVIVEAPRKISGKKANNCNAYHKYMILLLIYYATTHRDNTLYVIGEKNGKQWSHTHSVKIKKIHILLYTAFIFPSPHALGRTIGFGAKANAKRKRFSIVSRVSAMCRR